MTATATAAPIALNAVSMTKTFGAKVAVDDVSIQLRRGQIHALLGENGAGKSTLISMLCGAYRPDHGHVEVAGTPVRLASPKEGLTHGVGVVHQDYRLVGGFTVLENLVLGTTSRPNRHSWTLGEQLMAEIGFRLDRDARVSALSVGEKQQLEILRLLFRGAQVLILDEPTAVLTPQQSERLFAALRLLADQGKAILFVSHKLREVAQVSDWVTIMRGGRQVASQPLGVTTHVELANLMMGSDVSAGDEIAPGTPGDVLLRLSNAHTVAGRASSLRGVDIELRAGEILGIAGVSGNGQRDLADLAAGLLAPTKGQRTLSCATVGYVPEDRLAAGLVGSMSVAENLAMRTYRDARQYHPLLLSRRTMAQHALPLIKQFSIPAGPEVPAGALSGGGQQRTILAREISARPDVLVVCQPTRGLDVVSAEAVHAHLVAVRDRGGAVLLVSEDLDEILRLSDRIAVMVNGRVTAEVPRGQADRQQLGLYMSGAEGTQEATP